MVGSRGFTVLELMIVVAVAAILLTLAVPSLRTVMLTARRSDASTSLYGALVNARSEAIVRNSAVTVCQRAAGTAGAPQCALTSGSWTSGWIVYNNAGGVVGSGPADPASIIAVGDAVDSAFVMNTAPAATGYLQFQASGRANWVNSSSDLIWTLCKSGDSRFEGRQIDIAVNGRVSLSPYTACPGS